jgi:catechol 2,3-dioxygenase-like lactoylglutathione lyase family enzyme
VSNLDRTVEFYKTVFGFEVYGDVGRPLVNSAMSKLTATPDALYRQAVLKIPFTGLVLRLIEFSGVDRTPVKASLTDPGQIALRLYVGDMDAALVSLQRAKAEILVGAPPAARPGAARGPATAPPTPSLIVTRDPDGYFIEIEHGVGAPPSNVGAAAITVLNAHVVMTTVDTDKKMAFYHGLLGMDVPAGSWEKMPAGRPGEVRKSTSKDFGGANRVVELCEYRNTGPSKPVSGQLKDPGVAMVSFMIRDLDDALKAVKEANLPIVSADGAAITVARLSRIIVRDPDGTYVELVQE